MKSLIKKQNIGPGHPLFNHNIKPEFTQVLVILVGNESVEDMIIAQFYGAMAKQFAARLVDKLTSKD